MARTQVRGNSQIITQTIVNSNILDSTIELIKLAEGSKLLKQDVDNNYDANNFKIKNLANGELDTDAATYGQVKSVLESGSTFLKKPCKAVSVETITALTSIPQVSLDNASLSVEDRVLIKDFDSDRTKNGIYTVSAVYGSAGNYTYDLIRAEDADVDSEMQKGIFLWITDGDTFACNQFVLFGSDTDNSGILNIGIDELIFERITGLGMVEVGFGLTKNPTTINDGLELLLTENGGLIADENGLRVDNNSLISNAWINEIPVGLINGTNKEFIANNEVISGSELVLLNGIVLERDADYSIVYATKTITMTNAPLVGDKVRLIYFKK